MSRDSVRDWVVAESPDGENQWVVDLNSARGFRICDEDDPHGTLAEISIALPDGQTFVPINSTPVDLWEEAYAALEEYDDRLNSDIDKITMEDIDTLLTAEKAAEFLTEIGHPVTHRAVLKARERGVLVAARSIGEGRGVRHLFDRDTLRKYAEDRR